MRAGGKSRPEKKSEKRMLKPILAAVAFAALVACAATKDDNAPANLPAGGSERCDAAAYGYLVGQSETEIDRTRLPKAFRIICAECMVTQDFSPNRLNILLDTDRKVGSVRCG